MNEKTISGIFLTSFIINILIFSCSIQRVETEPATIVVPDDYPTIQEAINNANTGDIIYVRAGIYYENVVVNKSVALIGENRETTIIDGNRVDHVVLVKTEHVTITGFTIQNSGKYCSGIFIEETSGSCNISHNILRRNDLAGINVEQHTVPLRGHANHNIVGNVFVSNYYGILLFFQPQNSARAFSTTGSLMEKMLAPPTPLK